MFCIFFFGIATFAPIVGNVLDNSPAKLNDIKVNDIIISVNNNEIFEFSDIPIALGNNEEISIIVQRNSQLIEKTFKLQFNDEINRYVMGISSNMIQ